MSHIEHHAQTRLDARHVISGKLAYLIAECTAVHIQLSDQMCQFARIDLHRTRSGAETIRRTGLVAIVFVLLTERCSTFWILARCLEIADLSLYSYAHTAR